MFWQFLIILVQASGKKVRSTTFVLSQLIDYPPLTDLVEHSGQHECELVPITEVDLLSQSTTYLASAVGVHRLPREKFMNVRHSERSLKHYLQTASKITKLLLLRYNYKVLTASNGIEAMPS